MISPAEVAVLDLNSAGLGVEPWTLMSRAGLCLSEEVQRAAHGGKVIIVCGPGNNGGDGLVCANHLSRMPGFAVEVIYMGDPSKPRTELAAKAISELDPSIPFHVLCGSLDKKTLFRTLKGKDIVVDAILGSGSRGRLRGDIAAAVETMNEVKGIKVAVDIPTGLGTGPCFRADLTVTFHDEKQGMRKGPGWSPCCGKVVIRDIGIPREAALMVGPGDLLRIPVKGVGSKKGERGRILIVGGGPYTGAPALAAVAAVRAGCDLVRVAVPYGVHPIIASYSPDIIVEPLSTYDPYSLGSEVLSVLRGLAERSHCVLLGPGAGSDEATLDLLSDLAVHVSKSGTPLVIDADGLTSISCHLAPGRFNGSGEIVLTPHRGELKGLVKAFLPNEDPSVLEDPITYGPSGPRWTAGATELVGMLAMKARAVILAKGPADLMVYPGVHSLGGHIGQVIDGGTFSARTNTRGVPEMSVGGTGDILAGLTAGLMACGMGGFDAACISAYVNGTGGEAARAELGRSLSASSLLRYLRFSP